MNTVVVIPTYNEADNIVPLLDGVLNWPWTRKLISRASRLGMRIVEVPITFADRTAGSSKMTGSIVREALLRVLSWRLKELLHGSFTTRSATKGKHNDVAA